MTQSPPQPNDPSPSMNALPTPFAEAASHLFDRRR
jgi:hypothetical protein